MDEKRKFRGRNRQNEQDNEFCDQPPTITKTPIILMKPPPRKVVRDEEEWPAVNKSITIIRASQSSTLQPSKDNRSNSPLETSASTSGYTNQPDPITIKPTVKRIGENPASRHYHQSSKSEVPVYTARHDKNVRPLRGGIRLVTESMEWSDLALEHLTDQANFLVVGIVGPQGVGKSTLISMIGGNDPFDMYRQYIFRPASKECTETGSHQTQGIQFYINDNRTILLDSQPILSPSVMNLLINFDHRYNFDCNSLEDYVEIESLQLVSFMLQVCHVVIFVTDYFIDVNMVNFLRSCEMLKTQLPIVENPTGSEHLTHVVFVQNRARKEDFTINAIKKKSAIVEQAFSDSTLLCSGSVTMKRSSYPLYKTLKDCSANLFILPDMKPRGYKAEAHNGFKGIPDFELLMKELRNQIVSLPRHPFSPILSSEKAWFHFAARMWDLSRKSLLIAEYGRLL